MKHSKLLILPVLGLIALTSPSVNAYDCSGEKKSGSEVVISNEYKDTSSAYKKTMKDKKDWKNKQGSTMEMFKMRLGSMSVEKLTMVQTKMSDLKKKIPTTHSKYGMFIELETYINGLIGTTGAEGDLVDVAVSNGGFPTLIAAVQAAGLVETLQSEGPFTVFAPTEEAFAELLANLNVTAEDLLSDTELLTTVLTYHVVPGLYQASDVVGLTSTTDFTTAQGSTVSINPNGGAPMINESNIIATDVFATNGIIHVIDKVLLP